MTLPSSRQQREYDKFVERGDGQTAIATDTEAYHFSQTLADVTNSPNGTYAYYLDMAGAKYIGVQFEKTGGVDSATLTLEATIQDDGTAAAAITTWQDVTLTFTGAANFTSDAILLMDTPVAIKYLKIQVVTAGGNNDADYAIYSKIVS
jgi:hypothetical protein